MKVIQSRKAGKPPLSYEMTWPEVDFRHCINHPIRRSGSFLTLISGHKAYPISLESPENNLTVTWLGSRSWAEVDSPLVIGSN